MLKNLYPRLAAELPSHVLEASEVRGYPMGLASNEDDYASELSGRCRSLASGYERESETKINCSRSMIRLGAT
jgi:hypothetical protein